MKDNNDPQLLGEHILKLTAKGMKATDAADQTYEDMRDNGWTFGPVRSAVPPATEHQPRPPESV